MNRIKRIVIEALLFIVIILAASCTNPLSDIISKDVEAKYPHIILKWHDGTEIAAGGEWDIGSTVAGTAREIILSVENQGDGNLTLTGEPLITISGTDAEVFSLTAPPASSVLPPGGSTTFTLSFLSSDLGEKRATVSVQSNDTDLIDYSITLVGHITAIPVPDILVRVGSTVITDGTGSYEFENAYEGTYEDVTFTIESSGSADLVLDSSPITISGDQESMFTVPVLPATSTLASGETATFTIRFTPIGGAGIKNASLGIASNDPDENPFDFSLTGTITPEIDILVESAGIPDSGSHEFTPSGAVIRTTPVDVIFTISNPGSAALELTGVSDKVVLSGTDAAQFSVISQPISPVAAKGSTSFTIRYLAEKLNLSGASVLVENSDPDEDSYSFSISGSSLLGTVVTRIAAGEQHTVVLKAGGTVWTWGYNGFGRLGDGTTDDRHAPVQVSSFYSVVAVAVGQDHTVALKSDGTVWTWGGNNYGQLGIGSADTGIHSTPVLVSGLTDVAAIAAGQYHTVALKSDGTVCTWGYNGNGQLGDNSAFVTSYTPVQVYNLSAVTAIAAGESHTLALKTDGSMWSWGNNANGRLGDNSTIARLSPVPVYNLSAVTAIVAGDSHTVALKTDGTVWAWGYNGNGQLGIGSADTITHSTAVQVLTDVGAIAAGGAHTLARKTDGTAVWAWGRNDDGQLGDGFTADQHSPVLVSGFTDTIAITAGGAHTVALKTDGTVWAWGLNLYGRLGDGTTTNRITAVQVTAIAGIEEVAAGGSHTMALKVDGTVWAWGYNGEGRLGDGFTINRHTPVQVSGLTDVIAIAAGGGFGLALKDGGTVWAWGSNTWGQLGDGTTDDRYTPVQVSGLTGISAIAAGLFHAVAIKSDGTVWAWGYNNYGQQGIGSADTDPHSTPVQVQTGASAIAAGSYHTLALKSDGTIVWAWGYNNNGQLGDGFNIDQHSPVEVSGLTGVSAIAAGSYHSVALKSDGTMVWAWGRNNNGQLGNGDSPIARNTYVAVSGLTGVSVIAAGDTSSIALKSDGTIVWAWGSNSYGQLGDNTTVNRDTPVEVPGLTGVSGFAVRGLHTIAWKTTEGSVWTWGHNNYGQLGDDTTVDRHTPVRGGILPLDLN